MVDVILDSCLKKDYRLIPERRGSRSSLSLSVREVPYAGRGGGEDMTTYGAGRKIWSSADYIIKNSFFPRRSAW